jgi:hypothetical protein
MWTETVALLLAVMTPQSSQGIATDYVMATAAHTTCVLAAITAASALSGFFPWRQRKWQHSLRGDH